MALKDSINNNQYLDFYSYFKQFCKAQFNIYDQISSIIIFGSFATKSYHKDSDIDICIMLNPSVDKSTFASLEKEIFNKFLDLVTILDRAIQCIFVYMVNLESLDKIFLENIITDGILIFGTESYRTEILKLIG